MSRDTSTTTPTWFFYSEINNINTKIIQKINASTHQNVHAHAGNLLCELLCCKVSCDRLTGRVICQIRDDQRVELYKTSEGVNMLLYLD